MKIIPTLEDIQDSKGYGEQRVLTSMERDLIELKRLHRICGDKKPWHEVMPTKKKLLVLKNGYGLRTCLQR